MDVGIITFACTAPSAPKILPTNEVQYKCELCWFYKHSCILNISRGDYFCLGHAERGIDANRAYTILLRKQCSLVCPYCLFSNVSSMRNIVFPRYSAKINNTLHVRFVRTNVSQKMFPSLPAVRNMTKPQQETMFPQQCFLVCPKHLTIL